MSQVKFDTAAPYLAVYLIFRRGNEVAFILRQNTKWMDNYYGLPAGKTERQETVIASAIREGYEETGAVFTADDIKPVLTVHRHSEDSDWIDITFEVSNWQGELYNAEPHMHKKLAWLDLNNLPENIVPNNRFILEQVTAGNSYAEFGW